MGIDHGNNGKKTTKKKRTVKVPLAKPKVIDGEKYPPDAPELKTKKKPNISIYGQMQEAQTSKPKVKRSLKKKKQAKESSNKTTITDTQKRGQVRQRYDLFEGRRLPKAPTKKNDFTKDVQETMKKKPGRPTQKGNTQPTQPKEFLPHIMKPLYVFPGGRTPKHLRKQTSGDA